MSRSPLDAKTESVSTAPAILRDAVAVRFGDRYSIDFCDIPAWIYEYSVTLTSDHGERTCAVIARSKAEDPEAIARLTEYLGQKLSANESAQARIPRAGGVSVREHDRRGDPEDDSARLGGPDMSTLETLAPGELIEAIKQAGAHVYRQQHDGSHEQDRWDAMVWRERYAKHGRCKCAKCESAWKRGDPSA